MIDVKKYEINVTVVNGQKMKCELKGSVNMKLQDGKMVKLTEVLYVPKYVKHFLDYQGLSQRAPQWVPLRIK